MRNIGMRWRNPALAFMGVFLMLGLSACGDANKQAKPLPAWLKPPLEKPLNHVRVGFASIGAGVNGYTATFVDTFDKYADELGVDAIVLDAQADPARQADQVLDLIAQQVDVLVVWPVNAKAVVPAVRQAANAGIPVIIANSQIDPSGDAYTKSFSGPNDYAQAQLAAEMMVKALGGKGNVVMINGTPGYTASELRVRGFLDVMKRQPGIRILDQQPANWSREKSQSLMENYITRFGDQIDAVYSADSNSGIGALAAAKAARAAGKLSKQLVFTDPTFTAAAYDAVKAGEYNGSVVQSPVEDARAALKTAVLLAEKRPVPRKNFLTTPVVTRDNIGSVERPIF